MKKSPWRRLLNPFSPPSDPLRGVNWQRNRQNLLRNVQNTWIDGYLKHSLHNAIELELGLEYKPDAVSRAWGIVLQRPGLEPEKIPDDKSIYDVFVENGRSLLILGEPGSGKTITLLQLARDLIIEARGHDTTYKGLPEGMSPTLHQQLRTTLLDCYPWDSVPALRALFVDKRINPWQHSLPEANSVQERVEVVVNYLYHQFNDADENALVLFLQVLGERVDPGDAHHRRLVELGREVKKGVQKDTIQTQPRDKSESYPIPVALNLSSWGLEQQPLADWLVEEMSLQYTVSRKLTKAWLEQGELLLLLDGLDEVALEVRGNCVEVINSFKAQYPIEIIVCSRIADYEQLNTRLNLSNAILVQSLTPAQMDAYLARFGRSLQGIRQLLLYDEDLQELAKSPLTLSIMPIAYSEASQKDLSLSASLDDNRRHLFATYVTKMFERRPVANDTPYNQSQALHWLTNLAYGISQHNQSIFYIERLQLTWLFNNQKFYYMEIILLSASLIAGLVIGPGIGLSIWSSGDLSLWLSDGLNTWLTIRLILSLIFGLIFGLAVWFAIWPITIIEDEQIQLVEKINFVRSIFFRALNIWLRVGMGGGLIFGLIGGLITGSVAGLITGLINWLIIGLLVGLREFLQIDENNYRTVPNQGIQDSRRNAVKIGLIIGGIGGSAGMIVDFIFGIRNGPIGGLIGIGIGLSVGMGYGGKAFIQHYILRYFLSRYDILPFPWRDKSLIDFLDNMADRILLRRVGGGWVFIHRYLLEYFASLHEE